MVIGRPLTPAALDHLVRRWFARVKVPLPCGAAAHAFRHTVAMQLAGRGEPVNVVQALLGHASLRSTRTYIRAARHHVRGRTRVARPGAAAGAVQRGIGDAEQWRDDRTWAWAGRHS